MTHADLLLSMAEHKRKMAAMRRESAADYERLTKPSHESAWSDRAIASMFEAEVAALEAGAAALMANLLVEREFFAAGWTAHANETDVDAGLDNPGIANVVDVWLASYRKQRSAS